MISIILFIFSIKVNAKHANNELDGLNTLDTCPLEQDNEITPYNMC